MISLIRYSLCRVQSDRTPAPVDEATAIQHVGLLMAVVGTVVSTESWLVGLTHCTRTGSTHCGRGS